MADQYFNLANQSSHERADSSASNPDFSLRSLGVNNSALARLSGDAGLNLAASNSLSLPLSNTSCNNNGIGLINDLLGSGHEQNLLALAALQQQRLQQQALQRTLAQSPSLSTFLQQSTPLEVVSSSTANIGASTLTNSPALLSNHSLNLPQATKSPHASVSIHNDMTENSYETMLLTELGSSSVRRRKENSGYFDASTLTESSPSFLTHHPPRNGGVTEPFPERLHRLLKEVEENKQDDIIGFFSHGRAFAIHDREQFVKEIMPKYFKQSRLSSFQRQLNLYGFTRISSGPDLGGYYHELFLKGRPSLAMHMRRVGAPSSDSQQYEKTPNFYGMAPIKK